MKQSARQLIVALSRARRVCAVAEIADRALPRMRGLLGRTSLAPGEGLLLTPASSIHTAFMRFKIDAVFLDRDFRIVKLAPHLRPWRMAAFVGAKSVLELAAGEIEHHELEVGEYLLTREFAQPSVYLPRGRAVDPHRSVERLLAALFFELGG